MTLTRNSARQCSMSCVAKTTTSEASPKISPPPRRSLDRRCPPLDTPSVAYDPHLSGRLSRRRRRRRRTRTWLRAGSGRSSTSGAGAGGVGFAIARGSRLDRRATRWSTRRSRRGDTCSPRRSRTRVHERGHREAIKAATPRRFMTSPPPLPRAVGTAGIQTKGQENRVNSQSIEAGTTRTDPRRHGPFRRPNILSCTRSGEHHHLRHQMDTHERGSWSSARTLNT